MNDSNEEQPDVNTNRIKPIEILQATKYGDHGKPSYPTISVTRRKCVRFIALIVLVSLGAIAVIIFALRFGFAPSYEGLAAALCVVACGVLLIRRFIRVLAEEDELQVKQFNANQSTVSSSQRDPAGAQTNLTMPPPEAGESIKQRKP